MWVYLNIHVDSKDWNEIYMLNGTTRIVLVGAKITEENVTKMQHTMASSDQDVEIQLVMKKGATIKTKNASAGKPR